MTADLLGTRPPRAARRVLMHAVDTGSFPDGQDAARFRCRRCQHDSGWVYASRVEARRGVACPVCNGEPA